jgi:hypothetical protein
MARLERSGNLHAIRDHRERVRRYSEELKTLHRWLEALHDRYGPLRA